MPVGNASFEPGAVGVGVVRTVALRQALNFGHVLPVAHGQAGEVGSAQGRGFGHAGAHHNGVEHIGLKLHQQLVRRGAAVHAQLGNAEVRVGFHGLEHIHRLVSNGFHGGAGNVRRFRGPRNAKDGAPRIRVPVRRAQPGKGRHKTHPARVGHLRGQLLDFTGGFDNAQVIAQPLHHCACNKNAPLQGVAHLTVDLPANGRQQVVLRELGRFANVHQHKAARAVGAFHHARPGAHLPKQGGLLVAGDAGNRNFTGKKRGLRFAVHLTRLLHGGQHAARNVEQRQQLVVPGQGVDVEEHRARGVRHVRHVQLALGEIPNQPAVHGAKGQFAGFGLLPGVGHVVQNPAHLAGREIRIEQQAGFAPNQLLVAGLAQLVAIRGRTAVLPHNGVVDRCAGVAIPHHRRFALVGDADGRDVAAVVPRFHRRLGRHARLGRPDFARVVLDPARLRKYLGEFLLGLRHDLPLPVEQNGAGTGGALVEGEDELLHERSRV